MAAGDLVGYAVIHEYHYKRGDKGLGTASGVWPEREPVENALGHCEALQESGRPGTEGRYFVAEIREA